MFPRLTAAQVLPADGYAGTLVGRALYPGVFPGPCLVVLREDGVLNISGTVPTMAELLNMPSPLSVMHKATHNCLNLGTVDELLENSTPETHDPLKPYFLTPIDLQAVKASGVTFVTGMLQSLADENGGLDTMKLIEDAAGVAIDKVMPNTAEAQRVKSALQAKGLWNDILEVGFGPDAEVFTKTQPLSSVGLGAEIGVHPDSDRNFAEPEVVLVINADGKVRGATLGADVTLCDKIDQSTMLLGPAKDSTAACAVGPFIRLFDDTFSLPNVQGLNVTYAIEGSDGVVMTDTGSMKQLSRSLQSIVGQAFNDHHAYPDGLALFMGCMFQAPAARGGAPFSHKVGDVVTIKAPALGTLTNRVNATDKVRRWNFGIGELMNNLANRQLLG